MRLDIRRPAGEEPVDRLVLDRATFVKRLTEMRRVRNDVMHFNPDPPRPETVDQLRNMLRLLREYSTNGA